MGGGVLVCVCEVGLEVEVGAWGGGRSHLHIGAKSSAERRFQGPFCFPLGGGGVGSGVGVGSVRPMGGREETYEDSFGKRRRRKTP